MAADVSTLNYAQRLETFFNHWEDSLEPVIRQLAAIGHIAERPPLEVLEEGSRCITCSAFVKKDQSIRALGDDSKLNFQEDFRGFAFHLPDCKRLQVRIPLEPQALLGGLYGYDIRSLRNKFERLRPAPAVTPTAGQRLAQTSPLFTLPTELRLQIYSLVLPHLDPVTEIQTLHRDDSRVITKAGRDKTGPIDRTKPSLLRTCRFIHEEAVSLLYSYTTFAFSSSKIMYLFLRNIRSTGRSLLHSVDILYGNREDAMAFAMLASCPKLQRIIIHLPRPRLVLPNSPLWMVDGMAALLEVRGLREVSFGFCQSVMGCMDDSKPDAAVLRRELMRARGERGGVRWVGGVMDV